MLKKKPSDAQSPCCLAHERYEEMRLSTRRFENAANSLRNNVFNHYENDGPEILGMSSDPGYVALLYGDEYTELTERCYIAGYMDKVLELPPGQVKEEVLYYLHRSVPAASHKVALDAAREMVHDLSEIDIALIMDVCDVDEDPDDEDEAAQ